MAKEEKVQTESDEVLAAKKAHSEAKAKAEAEAKARVDELEKQTEDNIDRRRLSAERVARELEKTAAIRKKKADKKAKRLAKALETPLSVAERADMVTLEKRANQGTRQPDSLEMGRLSIYRVRAKIKG